MSSINGISAELVAKPAVLSCDGGNLSYQGTTPILTLTAKTAEQAGFAHGYLLGDTINQVIQAVTSGILASVELPAGLEANRSMMSAFIDQQKISQLWDQIPKNSQQEIDGVVKGFNKRLKEGAFEGQELTRDEMILFHLLPDKQHFDVVSNLTTVSGDISGLLEKLFGCTTVIGGDKETGPIFGRNLDWPSFGCLGDASVIVNRHSFETGKKIVELSFAGFVGTLTGINEDGLALAMNVCDGETTEIKGMQAAFFNRKILETCATAAKVTEFVGQNKPLGPYHLTVADKQNAAIHHLMQGAKNSHLTREKEAEKVLEAANCRYEAKKKGKEIVPTQDEYSSKERRAELSKHFRQKANKTQSLEAVEKALRLPNLNVEDTIHSVVIEPKEMKLKFAFANTMAASAAMQSLDLKALMGL